MLGPLHKRSFVRESLETRGHKCQALLLLLLLLLLSEEGKNGTVSLCKISKDHAPPARI